MFVCALFARADEVPLDTLLRQPLPAFKYMPLKGTLSSTVEYNTFPITVDEWHGVEGLILGDLQPMVTGIMVKRCPLLGNISMMSSEVAICQAWYSNITHLVNHIMDEQQSTYNWWSEPNKQMLQQQKMQKPPSRQAMDVRKPDVELLCMESYDCVSFAELKRR